MDNENANLNVAPPDAVSLEPVTIMLIDKQRGHHEQNIIENRPSFQSFTYTISRVPLSSLYLPLDSRLKHAPFHLYNVLLLYM